MRARSLASLLLCGLVAGLTVAAAALPAVGLAGLVTKKASNDYLAMPTSLRTPTPAQTTFVYANDGKTLITAFYDENRRDIGLAQVAPVMQQAIVAAEDSRFFQHGGVDLKGVLRAVVTDAGSGAASQGASTLTMQYVRNVLKSDPSLTPAQRVDATEDTPARKIQEMRYAVALEKVMSKQEILERYLNISYFGDGAYGISAAAATFFGKPASDLTLPEAALLAGLVQSPDTYNPVDHDQKKALGRRSYVLEAMAGNGMISQADAKAADASPIGLNPHPAPNDCTSVSAAHNDWGFFCDYFRTWWDAQPQFGATVEDREFALRNGGYSIVTSLDPGVQATALSESLAVYNYDNARSLPMAVVQPGTGKILAMAVNRHYSLADNPAEHPKYPNTVNQLVAGGGGVTGYQSGSTFKMFTMLAALQAGKTLDTGFDSPSPLVTKFKGDSSKCGGFYCPVNDNPEWMDGYRTMWNGFGRSVNTYFVWLEQQIGVPAAVDMAKKLGIQFRAQGDQNQVKNPAGWGAFTLGVVDTTPLDLANAYATVASGGSYCTPLPVTSIADNTGKAVPVTSTCNQVISPDVAAAAADAARCPVGQQSAFGKCDGGTATMVNGIMGGRATGGKTGSSENNATETFVGFTREVAAAGIACNVDDPRDAVGSKVSAAVDTAVAHTMAAAVAGLPKQTFPKPSDAIAINPHPTPTSSGVPGSGAPATGQPNQNGVPPTRQRPGR
jgi:membrane peptidoglycan carboxypeptidase